MKKRISFIITYHNEPLPLLDECIQSVLNLPLAPEEREILLIDDGSAVPAPSFDSGVTVFRQENQGLSSARNKGVELAQGDYIQFLDADDFLLTDAYWQVLSLQSQYQPDMLMFGFTRAIPRKENKIKGVRHYSNGVEFLLTRNMRASAWGYLFRKSVLSDLRFHLGILHEDELFTPQLLLRAKNLMVADIQAYYYRIGAHSITHQADATHKRRRLRDTLFVIKELDALAKTYQGKEERALRRRVSQLSMDYIYNGWSLTHSFREILSCIRSLKELGLFPLPLKCYTLKYWLFAPTINSLCVFL
ncbi:MAG: glycosyltransferase [Bacteroidaceae bacterium]|nr:glycosyltransferase [Bacteroidaceae bacterium]